jgi:hypothetical protein
MAFSFTLTGVRLHHEHTKKTLVVAALCYGQHCATQDGWLAMQTQLSGLPPLGLPPSSGMDELLALTNRCAGGMAMVLIHSWQRIVDVRTSWTVAGLQDE